MLVRLALISGAMVFAHEKFPPGKRLPVRLQPGPSCGRETQRLPLRSAAEFGSVCYTAPRQEVLTCSLRRGRDRWFLRENPLLYSRCLWKLYKGGVLVLRYCCAVEVDQRNRDQANVAKATETGSGQHTDDQSYFFCFSLRLKLDRKSVV